VRNVVLTGFMGTGKSTVGRLVADRLGYEFVDTDVLIAERHGPIGEIFRTAGEGAFRRYERELADELATTTRHVISTGGRLMLDAANARALGASGEVFCLTATLETVLARVTAADVADERPLLAGPDVAERIEMLLAERADGYGRFTQISTDARTPADVADEIVRRFAA
jgi:shikimate kinase